MILLLSSSSWIKYVDLNQFIPQEFFNAFYQKLGRKRLYPLTGFLSALILQKVFSIPTDSLLILLLNLCKEFRDFCGFLKIPDSPLFTRFKQDFLPYIERLFQIMVDFTEPLCQAIDASLADMLIFDTSGIELYVTENNPKTLSLRSSRLTTRTIHMWILIKWLTALCPLSLLPAPMQSSSTSTDILLCR
ncbi:MAG: transposase [Hungatella sp.]|jgi:hypothetical protein|nr:transposase [Hungatella sp.]